MTAERIRKEAEAKKFEMLPEKEKQRRLAYNHMFGMMSMEEITDLYCTTQSNVRQIELMMLDHGSWHRMHKRKRIRDYLDIT